VAAVCCLRLRMVPVADNMPFTTSEARDEPSAYLRKALRSLSDKRALPASAAAGRDGEETDPALLALPFSPRPSSSKEEDGGESSAADSRSLADEVESAEREREPSERVTSNWMDPGGRVVVVAASHSPPPSLATGTGVLISSMRLSLCAWQLKLLLEERQTSQLLRLLAALLLNKSGLLLAADAANIASLLWPPLEMVFKASAPSRRRI